MSDFPLRRNSALWLTLLLGFAGGYGDAASYIATKAFAGFITGNSVLFCIALARLNRAEMALLGTAVVVFLAGTALGVLLRRVGKGSRATRMLAGACVLEVALIAIAPELYAHGGAIRSFAFLVPVCLALGVQNGIFARPGGVSIHTTYMTGTTTSAIRALFEEPGATGRKQKISTIALDWLGFFCGAVSAALLVDACGVRAVWGLAVPLIAAAVVEARNPVAT